MELLQPDSIQHDLARLLEQSDDLTRRSMHLHANFALLHRHLNTLHEQCDLLIFEAQQIVRQPQGRTLTIERLRIGQGAIPNHPFLP